MDNLVRIAIIFVSSIILHRLVHLIISILIRRAEKTDKKNDDVLYPLLRKAGKTAVIIIGAGWILSILGMPITPLLAGAGIGAMAIAWAAKDLIANIFAAVVLVTEAPFAPGDEISINEAVGVVEEIGMRSVKIIKVDGTRLTIPNAQFQSNQIENRSFRDMRPVTFKLLLSPGVSSEEADDICRGMIKFMSSLESTTNDHVRISGISADGVQIEYAARTVVDDDTNHKACVQDAYLAAWDFCQIEDVSLGPPPQEIKMM